MNLLDKLDELSEKAKGHDSQKTIEEAIQKIESQSQEIEYLRANAELERETLAKAREAYSELQKKIEGMESVILNL